MCIRDSVDTDPQGSATLWAQAAEDADDPLPFPVVSKNQAEIRRMRERRPDRDGELIVIDTPPNGAVVDEAIKTADFVVIEGCKAGGHLGFSEEELLAGKCQTLDEILPEVLAEVKPFEAQFGHDIPVFVAGGVYTGEDIAHYTKMGAAGAQLATRFIPTYECDASQTYKDVLLAAKPEDVRIIHSPVGMPGRALATPLVQKLEQGLRFPPKHCARCLKACEPAKVPYCITHALIEAVKGLSLIHISEPTRH